MKITSLRAVLAAVLLAGAPALAAAAPLTGPQPIRLIVPFAAGGASDTVSRTVGAKMAEALGISVVVENRPGGGGAIGASAVLNSPADGRTIFVASNGAMVINPAIRSNLSYNPDKDFALVASMAKAPVFIWARSDLPVKDMPELVALAKKQSLNMASAGEGNITHLAGENMASLAGVEFTHVPFSGDSPALLALAGGNVDISLNVLTAAKPLLESGRIKPVALLNDARDPQLPNVATLTELGLSPSSASAWFGLAVPAGTPEDVIEQLNVAVNHALKDPAVQARLTASGFSAMPGSVSDFRQFYGQEIQTWRPLVAKLGIKAN